MSKENFHDRTNSESDLNAFEKQLRSIDPAPPQTTWHDMPQLLAEQHQAVSDQSEPGLASFSSPRWSKGGQRIATHAAATLIGIGIGIIWVMMLQPAVATIPSVDVESPKIVVEQKRLDARSEDSATQYLVTGQGLQAQRVSRYRTSEEIEYRNFGSRPLTPLGGEIESRLGRRIPHEFRPVALEESAVTFEPSELNKPMSAPELMRELLDKQAHVSAQRGRDVG